MSDVLVAGGGVIGLMSAWRLAQAGFAVEVFEKAKPGAEASAAALGVLSPQAISGRPDDFLTLSQASLALFPAVAEELRAFSGVDVELRDEGMLYAALDDCDAEALYGEWQTQFSAGVPARLLTSAEAQELEPALGPAVQSALLLTGTLQVDNIRLCRALELAAQRAGAQIYSGRMVTGIVRAHGQVVGVRVHGQTYNAPVVVLAAGCWSGSIEGISLPVRPAKGQALALEAPVVISHVLDSASGYVVPRRDGRLLVGATVEEAGYDKRVTVRGMRTLIADVSRLVPALEHATIAQQWAGLRPRSADDLPVIGPVSGCEGLIVATGHFRNGILLAPVTAKLVVEWAMHSTPSLEVAKFSPDRFGVIID